MWTKLFSTLSGFMIAYAMIKQFLPFDLRIYLERYLQKLVSLVSPYIVIKFHEHEPQRFKRSLAFTAIETYLAANSSKRAKRLKADLVKETENLVFSMDDHEELTDEFEGIKVSWSSNKKVRTTPSFSFFPTSEEKRFYKLTFHRRHRDVITEKYLKHVLKNAKEISVKNRQRKLYTNNPSQDWSGWRGTKWSHVAFEHPSTFQTLALEPKLKEEIIKDLDKFKNGKDYYMKIGKAWKRGYLLFGPPGTGKSTMIAAMANHLDYDVYDLELTAVKNNIELRKLLIETSGKSIIVIEDIDCSLDLTGQRKQVKEEKEEDDKDEKDHVAKKLKEGEKDKDSKVTLSGLLNFIDGIWSACGGERIIVFTTNYKEKLDPALIRRGRMDKHIELSYCGFEAFKLLARNYLDVDNHESFEKIKILLEETDMTPADVAENLMPKTDEEDPAVCFNDLIKALEEAKEEARKKVEEEEKKAEEKARLSAEKEEKEKKLAAEKETADDVKNSDEVKENGVAEENNETLENVSASN